MLAERQRFLIFYRHAIYLLTDPRKTFRQNRWPIDHCFGFCFASFAFGGESQFGYVSKGQ